MLLSMKQRIRFIVFASAAVVLLVAAYAYRWDIRDAWSAWKAPRLPSASKFVPPGSEIGILPGEPSGVEGGVATSQNFIVVSSPPIPQKKNVDPFENRGPLPSEANLDVPFTTQAPYQNWDYPYQEACEEASIIMADAFYRGKSGKISDEDAKRAIDAIVAYENKTLGFYKDTDAEQTAEVIKGYFGYEDVLVRPVKSADDIRRVVANGYPVILPAAGKLLKNPNFRNGGPLYHMLVVKGYTKDRFITNDPGTRRGADYTYAVDVLMNAIHDWNGGDVTNGAKLMIVILPKRS